MVTRLVKWTFVALLIQSLPSFGTGAQLDRWNTVADGHDADEEMLPDDYMMPMRSPHGPTGENIAEETKVVSVKKPASVSSPLNAVNNIVQPVTGILLRDHHTLKISPVFSSHGQTFIEDKSSDFFPEQQETESKLETSVKMAVTSDHIAADQVMTPAPGKLPAWVRKLPANDELPEEECEEPLQRQTLDAEAGVDANVDCQGAAALPTRGESDDLYGQSLLSLLRTGKKDESLEDIFKDVLSVMSRMSLSDKENIIQSIPFSQSEEEKMTHYDEKVMPKLIDGIRIKVPTKNSDNDFSLIMEGSDIQDVPLGNQVPPIKLASINRNKEEPKVKGILLKSLLSKHTPKELFEIVKEKERTGIERKMITSLHDPVRNRRMKSASARVVPLQNVGYTTRLSTPLLTSDRDLLQAPLSINTRPFDNVFVSRFINSLREPPKTLSNLGKYEDHSELRGLLGTVLRRMAEPDAGNSRMNKGPGTHLADVEVS